MTVTEERPDPAADPATDAFEEAPCGYVITDADGTVVRANKEFLRLVGRTADDVVGRRRLPSLVSVGGRIFFETHLLPMLEHDGHVREVAIDVVRPDGVRVPVLLNANRTGVGALALRAVLIEARDRRRYEDNLLHATQAAEAAREEAAALAESLQRTLIPPAPPTVPHLDIAAAYRPAGTGREVGGDFYDVFQVTPESWYVVLGDVSGKGIPAATVTTFVRHSIRSLAVLHPEPDDLLRHLDILLRAHPTDRYCTLVLVHLVRRDDHWDLRLSLAGHAPPLARRPDGTVVTLGTPGTPVGLVEQPAFDTVRHALGEETFVLFTDGVTEARGAAGFFGEERLERLLRRLPRDPSRITDGVTGAVLEFQDGNARDDIAVVAFAATP